MQLFREILKRIVYQRDSSGKIATQRAAASSINLPAMDEQATRKQMDSLMGELLETNDVDSVQRQLRNAVCDIKELYTQTHDGFSQAGGISRQDQIKVSDMYAFSVAAGYCFESLPPVSDSSGYCIAIGVMTPARQDCGKNLIRLVWQGSGHQVIDLGANLKPQAWLKTLEKNNVSALAVSCMKNECVNGLQALLATLKESARSLPVIIGGIGVNKVTAYELSQGFGIPVYYGHDVNDAEAVLSRALSAEPVDVPIIKEVEKVQLPEELGILAETFPMELYAISISDIVIDNNARQGCKSCGGDKRRLCPLETGFERQKSISESKEFLSQFKQAVIVAAKQPGEDDRQTCKSLWNVLITIEQYFSRRYNDAQAFRFPMPCPMCKPKDCKLPKGECMLPAYYRPVHERENINVTATFANAFGDSTPLGMCSIILIK